MNFIKRDLTEKISRHLDWDEILLVIGPRQAGKTTILRQIQERLQNKGEACYFLNLEDPDYLRELNLSPKNLFNIFSLDLGRKNFVFIDEVQYLANPANFLKYFFDEYRGRLKMIVSGSSSFYLDRRFRDSLAGRKVIFFLLPLSFNEFFEFKTGKQLHEKNSFSLALAEQEKANLLYREYLLYGGYPRVVLADLADKSEILRDIAYSYVKKDIFEADVRQEEIFYRLLKILSGHVGNLVNTSELATTLGVSKTAVEHYLEIMQKSFHLALIRPFFRNLRKELTKMPKVYFFDLGLRNFFKNDFRPLGEHDDKGQILENGVFSQLTDNYGMEAIKFWRTTERQEIDFVIEDEKKAFEVKWSPPASLKIFSAFLKSYPQIKPFIVSLEKDPGKATDQIIRPWEI